LPLVLTQPDATSILPSHQGVDHPQKQDGSAGFGVVE